MRDRLTALGAVATVALLAPACASGPDATITMVEDAIAAPSTVEAGTWTVDVRNAGNSHHNLTVCRSDDPDTCEGEIVRNRMLRRPPQARDQTFYKDVNDGLTLGKDWDATVAYDLEPGTYRLWCAVLGHAAAGMQTTLTVTDPS